MDALSRIFHNNNTSSNNIMAWSLKALSAILLLLAIALPYSQGHSSLSRKPPKKGKPKFKPGPWQDAHATFYGGDSKSFGGACSYKDVESQGCGKNTVAVSSGLFKNGQGCGACYEIKCQNSPECKSGQPSLFVSATNHCPCSQSLPNDKSNKAYEHFDIAEPVFSQLAEYKAGIIPIQYRRVPCKKQGGIRFTITGNAYFLEVIVWNVGGAGDVISVQAKGSDKLKWAQMQHDWGSTWKYQSGFPLNEESLTFRVRASDNRYLTSWHVVPKNWQTGQTYEGKNFK